MNTKLHIRANLIINLDIFANIIMRIKAIIASLLLFVSTHGGRPVCFEHRPDNLPSAAPLFTSDTLMIKMIGDVMIHTRQIELAHVKDSTYDFSSYFSVIRDSLKNADICIANMEFTTAGKPYTGYPAFSAPDSYIDYLASCGIDVLLASNNHIYDKGCAGASRTIRKIQSHNGLHLCGIATDSVHLAQTNPLTIYRKGMSVSMVNFTYGTNLGADKHWPKINYMSDRKRIKNGLDRGSDSDLVMVFPHWGEEYTLLPSESQRATAQWLAENGADVIIGTHPHVPQTFETVTENNIPVAYSLGNAVSNMSAANTQMELMATIRLVRRSNGDVEMLPIRFTYLWCSRPGGYGKSYTVIPVREFIGKKDKWIGTWDYDKMISTYERVKETIKIEDN